MHLRLNRALCASTALVTGLLLATGAMAQSTGTATVEELVVTGSNGPRSLDGAIVAVEAPKSRVSITQQYISTQAPSQTVLDTINLLPGQEVLTVPSVQAKIEAHLRCLGCGWVAEPLAREHIAAGRLVVCRVQRPAHRARLGYAWRAGSRRESPPGTACSAARVLMRPPSRTASSI